MPPGTNRSQLWLVLDDPSFWPKWRAAESRSGVSPGGSPPPSTGTAGGRPTGQLAPATPRTIRWVRRTRVDQSPGSWPWHARDDSPASTDAGRPAPIESTTPPGRQSPALDRIGHAGRDAGEGFLPGRGGPVTRLRSETHGVRERGRDRVTVTTIVGPFTWSMGRSAGSGAGPSGKTSRLGADAGSAGAAFTGAAAGSTCWRAPPSPPLDRRGVGPAKRAAISTAAAVATRRSHDGTGLEDLLRIMFRTPQTAPSRRHQGDEQTRYQDQRRRRWLYVI
jgi:hypothetical protein